MTTYVTPQDLIDAFGEAELIDLTDRATPRAFVVDVDVAGHACERAQAEIDAALAVRYALPLSAVPELLRFIAQDLARYYLQPHEATELVTKRWEAARTSLRDIAAGKASLGSDLAGLAVTPPIADLAEFDAPEVAFGAQAPQW